MALSIKSDHADRLARELAELTGESITQAVTVAIEERLTAARLSHRRRHSALDLAADFRRLKVLDARHPDALLGYDDHGLPT